MLITTIIGIILVINILLMMALHVEMKRSKID